MIYAFLTFWSFLLTGAFDIEVAEETLVLVHAIVRHGNRTPEPIVSFPNDIYRNATFYPYGEGELNQEGIKRSFQVGKELRKRYDNFLGPKYYPDMLATLSSGYGRCKKTMQLILAGMFPPDPSQTFEQGLAWQPIAYQYRDRDTDQMISFKRCISYMHTVELKQEFDTCENRTYINKYLTQHTGMKVESLIAVFFVYNTLMTELENGLSLPEWAQSIWPEPLFTCGNDLWRHFVHNKRVLGTMGGMLMKRILDETREKIKENSTLENRKFFLYTAHETSIYTFLGMLECYNNVILNYNAYLLFEIHKINGVYGFKFYLHNRYDTGLTQILVPDCGTFCPVESLYEKMIIYINSEPCP